MFISREKILLENIILFFVEKFKDKLTKTLLMKLLYEADSRHIAETGIPITGLKYSALPHGPVPTEVLDGFNHSKTDTQNFIHSNFTLKERARQLGSIVISTQRKNYSKGEFSKRQKRILDEVFCIYKNTGAATASKASHQKGKPWDIISHSGERIGDEIPYELILKEAPPIDGFTKEELLGILQEYLNDKKYYKNHQ